MTYDEMIELAESLESSAEAHLLAEVEPGGGWMRYELMKLEPDDCKEVAKALRAAAQARS